MAVARQELLHPERRRAMHRANEHDIADAARDQLDATEDECAHEKLAELAVGLHQRQQLLARQLDHLAALDGPLPDESAASGEHVDLAGELSRSMDGYEHFAGCGQLHCLQRTRSDDEKRHDLRTRLEEHFTALDAAHTAVPTDARD